MISKKKQRKKIFSNERILFRLVVENKFVFVYKSLEKNEKKKKKKKKDRTRCSNRKRE